MIITPRQTERAFALSQDNMYVFDVPMNANKATVKAQIEADYPDVKVKSVRMVVSKGKVKAVNLGKRNRPGTTKRQDTKKAYVTLTSGKIDAFKGLTESEEDK